LLLDALVVLEVITGIFGDLTDLPRAIIAALFRLFKAVGSGWRLGQKCLRGSAAIASPFIESAGIPR